MIYLLDTNALLFSLADVKSLSDKARNIIETEENLCVSIASLWEIAIKQSIGKLSLSMTIPEIQSECYSRSIEIVPIKPAEIEKIKALPKIPEYPVQVAW